MDKYSILIADDQQSNLETILGYLEASGNNYKILNAINGRMACMVAERKLPDLIIMDWDMPEMTGIEAIIYLKEQEETKDIPIIMATALSSSSHLEKALDVGAVDFIRKPIDKVELVARIQSALALSESYQKIKTQNKEIQQQKQHILEKNQELAQKNVELEQQKEEILTQREALEAKSQILEYKNNELLTLNAQITDQKEEINLKKEQLEKKNEDLIDLNSEKNNLIQIVAHDLKSPLNHINGLINIIKISANNINEEQMSYINRIEKSTEQLKEMIAQILDVEALEAKMVSIKVRNTNITEIIRDIIEANKEEANQKNITIHTQLADNQYGKVDPVYTQQIFANLISNAIKFSPQDKEINVRQYTKDKYVITEIQDQGPGFSQEDLKKIFKKFQRLSARPTGGESSTGLGLSIVKKFTEAMGGTVEIDQQPRSGAKFIIKFLA